MKAIWHIACPKCSMETQHPFELHNVIGPEVIWECDEDQGGCGAKWVVRPMAALEARIRVVNTREFSARCTFKGGTITKAISEEGGAQ